MGGFLFVYDCQSLGLLLMGTSFSLALPACNFVQVYLRVEERETDSESGRFPWTTTLAVLKTVQWVYLLKNKRQIERKETVADVIIHRYNMSAPGGHLIYRWVGKSRGNLRWCDGTVIGASQPELTKTLPIFLLVFLSNCFNRNSPVCYKEAMNVINHFCSWHCWRPSRCCCIVGLEISTMMLVPHFFTVEYDRHMAFSVCSTRSRVSFWNFSSARTGAWWQAGSFIPWKLHTLRWHGSVVDLKEKAWKITSFCPANWHQHYKIAFFPAAVTGYDQF